MSTGTAKAPEYTCPECNKIRPARDFVVFELGHVATERRYLNCAGCREKSAARKRRAGK